MLRSHIELRNSQTSSIPIKVLVQIYFHESTPTNGRTTRTLWLTMYVHRKVGLLPETKAIEVF